MKKVILKILSITIALLMLLSVNVSFYATDALSYIIAEDVIISAEDTQVIEVPVSVSENQGVMGFMILVSYDSDILAPVSVERGEALGSGLLNDSIGAEESNVFKVMWTGSENSYADGILFKLKFKLLTNDFDSTKISFDYSQPDTFNEKYDDVYFSFDNSTVYNQSGVLIGDVNGDGLVNIVDATEIQKYLADIVEFDETARKSADFNSDNRISVVDATDIQKYLVNN